MKKTPFLRTPYNYDTNDASDETALRCEDPTLTKQAFAEEVDINTIVRRFNLTGQLPENVHMPTYADFEDIFDFQTAMNAVRQAEESFNEMPAHIRARFHNNAAEFVDFCSDEDNRPEAEKLGLVQKKSEPKQEPATGTQKTTVPPLPGGQLAETKGKTDTK